MDSTEILGPYGRLARWVSSHAQWVSLSVVFLVVVSIISGLPPEVDSNLLALLPKDEPAVQALKVLHEEEGGANLVTIALSSKTGQDIAPLLTRLVKEFSEMEAVEFAVDKLDPDLAYQIAVTQLEPEDLDELLVRMKGALSLGPALNPIVTQRLMDMGPLLDRIRATSTLSFLSSPMGEGRILIKPTGSSHDQEFARALMADIEGILDRHIQDNSDAQVLWIGGSYRHNVEDTRGIQQDLMKTSAVSAILVFLVIMVAFRTWRGAVLVFIPLSAAAIINLALTQAFLGPLNTYTSIGTAIIIGLGIDFAVHLMGRYREYRTEGLSADHAIEQAWERTGPACTTAALTSAAGFLALAAADFEGFSQLGLSLAMGLIIGLLCMLVMLPILIPRFDKTTAPILGTLTGAKDWISHSTYRTAPLGLMLVVLVTCTLGALRLPQLTWEFDVSALRQDGLAYSELSPQERALAKESYSPVVVTYPSFRALSRAQKRVSGLIERDELPYVSRAISLASVLPKDQEERLERMHQLRDMLEHENIRYIPPALVERLMPLKGREFTPLKREDLPPIVLKLLGAEKKSTYRLLLFPKGNMWDVREANALSKTITSRVKRKDVAGEYMALGALYRLLMRDLPLVGGLALLMVCALTFIDLKRLTWAMSASGTLIAGIIWAGSMIELFGIKMSLLNVVGIPILLGIGVDVVIHLLHRLRDEGPGGVRRALRTTGVAASISTLTTMASFGALMVAGNRGVRSLGELVVVGLAMIFVVSVIVLPLTWAAGWRMTGQVPADLEGRQTPKAE